MGFCVYRAVFAVLVCLSLAGRVGAQTPNPSEMYDRVLSEAIGAFKARQWTKARALFERAHELSPSARTLRGIGVTAYEGGEYVAAIHALEAALVHPERQLPGDLREGTRVLIAQARERVGSLLLTLEPAQAQVRCDGRNIAPEPDGSLLLDPGVHVLAVEAEGFVAHERSVTITGDQRTALHVALERASPVVVPEPAVAPDTVAPVPALSVTKSAASDALHAPTTVDLRVRTERDAPPEPRALLNTRGRRILAYGTLSTSVLGLAASVAIVTRAGNLNQDLRDDCAAFSMGICPESFAAPRKATIARYERGFGATAAVTAGAAVAAAVLFTLDLLERRRERRARRRPITPAPVAAP
jgi:hypothetical protein